MEIRIIKSIDDPFLKSEWERLETESDIFPQSTYHWCSTWWKFLSGKRKLHVVMALDDEGKTVALAPLCIERNFGVSILRSFPDNFGDFYDFITPISESSLVGIDTILNYIAFNNQWRWIKLNRVSERSHLARSLAIHSYRKKRTTGCVIVNFSGLGWEEYLARLKKGFRNEIRRRLKRINEAFNCEFIFFRSWDEYEKIFEEMLKIHKNRWEDDNTPTKGVAETACWKEAIKGQFDRGRMIYYQLLFDGVPVSYRLGFIYRGTYYAWHTSFNPYFRNYNVGIMILAFMIKHFMNNGVSVINFMSGDYHWKLDWSPDRRVEEIFMFTSPPDNIIAAFLNWYYYEFRDVLKALYHRAMRYNILRAASRNSIRFYQKLTRLR